MMRRKLGIDLSKLSEDVLKSEIPNPFAEDVKIEQSAKGARVTLHVFSNNDVNTLERVILLYKQTISKLQEEGIIIVPVETKREKIESDKPVYAFDSKIQETGTNWDVSVHPAPATG